MLGNAMTGKRKAPLVTAGLSEVDGLRRLQPHWSIFHILRAAKAGIKNDDMLVLRVTSALRPLAAVQQSVGRSLKQTVVRFGPARGEQSTGTPSEALHLPSPCAKTLRGS